MSRSAPLLDDQPSPKDLLNFGQYATALREIILNPQTKTPLIIGIFGRWGTGKTTLMRMLENELELTGVRSVWFSAWLYSQESEIWAAFLQSLTTKLSAQLSFLQKLRFAAGVFRRGIAWSRLLYEAPRLVVRAFLAATPVIVGTLLATKAASRLAALALQLGGALTSAALATWAVLRPALSTIQRQVKPDFSLYRSMDFESHIGFLDRFREQFGRIVVALPGTERRVVAFVDDLDRCGAEKALQLLDAIKVFLDVPGCIFVLGVDITVIQRAITQKYRDDDTAQKEYLSKIIQLPFHLPPLTEGDLRTYLLGLDVRFPDERCREVFLASLSRNPRELKRVINTYSLHWYLAQARDIGGSVTPVRLAKVMVIQQAYGSLFALLRDQPQLLSLLERRLRQRMNDPAVAEPESHAETTQVVAPSGVSVPPALVPFVEDSALARLLTMHGVQGPKLDDANFLDLTSEEIQVYFTLTRRAPARPSGAGSEPPTWAAESEPVSRDPTIPTELPMPESFPDFGPRYHVLQRIGLGGASEVFLAEDRNLRRKVAIKRLVSTLLDDPSWVARFERETRMLSRVGTHPNIATIYEVGSTGGTGSSPFYVMEYLAGESLELLLRRERRLSPERTLSILVPIFDALAHIHATGIVHRDVKPSTILISSSGVPKLADFGLAVEPVGGRDVLTSTGFVIGTPAYMSPEQAADKSVDHRSDLFSLGLVIYECLTGSNPVVGGSVHDTMMRLFEPIAAPSQVDPALPASLDVFMERMLAREPENRFAAADEAREVFREALRGQT